jgi:DNA-binding IclR family transcriptional regulator
MRPSAATVEREQRGRVPVIQSVDRAARILKALSGGTRGLGVSELAGSLGLAKTTVHGLLRTLQEHGLVEQNLETAKYQLGPALLELSSGYLDLSELRARSLAWSELLALRTGESVRVGVLHDNAILVIHHAFRPDTSVQILEVGAVLPLHATALGKAVLAYAPEEVRRANVHGQLTQLTGRTVTTAEALSDDLQLVRRRRYALEHEEAILGENGVASPIFDRRGQVVGAIGIAGARERLEAREDEERIVSAVIDAARNVSRDLGVTQWPPF